MKLLETAELGDGLTYELKIVSVSGSDDVGLFLSTKIMPRRAGVEAGWGPFFNNMSCCGGKNQGRE